MLVTEELSKPDKSRLASEDTPRNMKLMFSTAAVSKPDRSRLMSEDAP